MARLPAFQNEQTIGSSDLNTGGFTRLNQPNTDTANAMVGLGGEALQAGEHQMKIDAHIAAKAAKQAEADANMMLESRLLDYRTNLQAEALKRADDMPEGGFGYAAGMAETATKEAEATIARDFSTRPDQDYVNLRFQRERQSVVDGAMNTEFKARTEWRTGIINKKVADLQTTVGADPENFDNAAAELEVFVSNTLDAGENTKQQVRQLGLSKLARAELDARAAANPEAYRGAYKGGFINQPVLGAEPHITGIVNAANDNGLDPRLLLGVAKIESNLDPKAGSPTRADGTKMSSADGMWQVTASPATLADLGISKEDRTNYAVSTPAVARFFTRQKAIIEKSGQEATPGKLFMTYNMGAGAAAAVRNADPNTPIEQVFTKVYGAQGPAKIEEVLGNNPRMYKRGMTAGQVLSNYERQMGGAMKSSAGYVTGKNLTTDAQAQAVFEGFGVRGSQYLTARDAAETFVSTNASIQKQSAADAKLKLGIDTLNGDIPKDRYDPERHAAVDEAVGQAGVSTGIASGDQAAVLGARHRANAVGFITGPDVNGFREAMNINGVSDAKATAYAALADIATNDGATYDASKLPEDEKKRVQEYRAYTEVMGLKPFDAIKRIDDARTPDGKKTAEAMAKQFGGKKGELEQLTFADIQNRYDTSGIFHSFSPVTDKQQAIATETYRNAYQYHRERGKDVEDAKSLALMDMDNRWGTSSLTGSQVFMPYPPEKQPSIPPIGGSHQWVQDAAKNTVASYLVENGILKDKVKWKATGKAGAVPDGVVTAKEQMGNVDVRLIPRAETADDIRSGNPIRYELWYTRPDGQKDHIPDRWFTPSEHFKAAEQKYDDEFKKRGKPTKPDPNALDGLAYSP